MNKNNKLKQLSMISLAASAAFLAGCGGSSSSGGAATSPVSGVAFDGYLIGATVCADLNRNKACDAGEPTTTTTAPKGEFTLNLTDAQKAFPLVLVANENTIDADTNAVPPLPLKYSAPAGAKTLSAVTTMLQAKIESKLASGTAAGKTQAQLNAEANAELAQELGVPGVDLLNTDVIAAKEDTTKSEAERRTMAVLHITNQLLTGVLADALQQAAQNPQLAAANQAALFNVAASQAITAAIDFQSFLLNNYAPGLPTEILLSVGRSPALLDVVEFPVPSVEQVQEQVGRDQAANNAAGQIPPSGGTGTGG